MARQELHSNKLPSIEQRAPIAENASTYAGDVITGENLSNTDYLSELMFMEEPITIRLEPSSDQNAPTSFPFWCNGKPAEVFQRGQWEEIGFLPVGRELIIKRKILEIIVRAKTDTVNTQVLDQDSERPNNTIRRHTSPVLSFSVIADANPRGASWMAELRRRNL